MTLDERGLERLRVALRFESFEDRFELGEEAGRGGMGVVYRAIERDTGRVLAVKILAEDVYDQARFALEAEVLERLEHPAIVRYAHHGVTANGRAYLAMYWLDGASLATRLRGEPLAMTDVLSIGARVAAALAHAHARHILHRDLKPSNVMLVDDQPTQATLIDFGVAKDLRAATLTKAGQLVGTPAYMAPEQVTGGAIDARVDLFALGCLLYEALTGAPPFEGAELMEVLAQVLLRSPPPVSERRADVPKRLEAVIGALLEKRPEHRVADATVVAEELSAISVALAANDTAALATPAAPFRGYEPTLVSEMVRRRRWPIGVVGAGLAVVAGIVIMNHSPPEPPRGPREVMLPAFIDTPRVPGKELAVAYREPAGPDQLGSRVEVASWCASRGVSVLVTVYGRIVSVDRAGVVSTLAKVTPSGHNYPSAVTCLASGRIVGVLQGATFVLDGAAVLPASPVPSNAADVIALGTSARWVSPGKLWEWDGTGEPRTLRVTCEHPLRLSPDGTRVACLENQHIVVDDGTTTIEGPMGTSASWSHDGRALYVQAANVVSRWKPGTSHAADILTTGTTPIESGPWLVTKNSSESKLTKSRFELDLRWIGHGPPRSAPPIDLGPSGEFASVVTSLGDSAVVVAYDSGGVRVVELEGNRTAVAGDRHLGKINSIGFSIDGTSVVTLGVDHRMIVHTPQARRVVGEIDGSPFLDTPIAYRADGSIVAAGSGAVSRWDPAGHMTSIRINSLIGRVAGTDELVRCALRDGIATLVADGRPGIPLAAGPLPRGVSQCVVDRGRLFIMLRIGSDLIELLEAGHVAFTISTHGQVIQGAALVPGGTVVVADRSGQTFAVTERAVTPIVKLKQPNAVLAASPVDRRVAIAAGREVIIFDLDRGIEIGRSSLDSTVTALEWSRDGTRLAGAGASTELAVWEVR